MNVACTNCESIFRVDPAKVPVEGVRARCSVCNGIFWVTREEAVPSSAPASIPPRSPEPASAPPPPPRIAAPQAPAPVAPPEAPRAPQPPIHRPMAPAAGPVAPPPAAAPASPRPLAPPPPAFGRPAPAAAPKPVSPGAGAPPPGPAFSAPGIRYTAPPPAPPPAARPAPPAAPPPPAPVTPRPKRPTNPFLSQDPDARARRLARALISDIVVYHPAKRRDALRDGSLKLMFEEEIRKSWEEYVDQVGKELADATTYFNDALNEILADGQPVFP